MNENIQQILYYGVAFLCGVIATIIGIFLHNRCSVGELRAKLQNAKRDSGTLKDTESRIADTVECITGTVETIGDGADKLEQSIESSGKILEEVRKQKLD